MAAAFDAADSRLLNLIQTEIPLTAAPWAALAARAALAPGEALTRVVRLKAKGLIRRLGGIFDSRRLGYRGTLCAFRAPAGRVQAMAAVINAYAGVTHNYTRRHEYNMWCTLLAPGQAELERLTEEMRSRVGADKWLNLPARRYFKVRVNFPVYSPGDPAPETWEADRDARERAGGAAVLSGGGGSEPVFTDAEKRLIAALQDGLPLTERPYAALAAGLGQREEDVLAALILWREQGVLKRVAAVPRHRLIGYSANALVVWRVPAAQVEVAGRRLAARPEVTHCYERESPPGWPYNVYAMIHARSEDDCRALAGDSAEMIGIKEYELLFSEAELKKSSIKYFA
ncbi:MAG: Lrp/AsnC family transcriptional regulator [Gracilibacteraceae bacterium]|jgi:DNA-binding Lrp family transcriptional regulator|nr:Lrp/AsnC family transcriptional regulator [Gracilibacteraceae bacterium]